MTPMQEKLIKKLGNNAFPLTFHFPQQSPSSVTLQAGEDDGGKPLGVEYYIKVYVGENEDDKSHKRSTVSLTIKKLQYAPPSRGETLQVMKVQISISPSFVQVVVCRRPWSARDSRSPRAKSTWSAPWTGRFIITARKSPPTLSLPTTLGRPLRASNGEQSWALLDKQKVTSHINSFVVQHCEVTMVNAQFSKHVASLETREGCPITPGASFSKSFLLVPLASSNKDRRGELEGKTRGNKI